MERLKKIKNDFIENLPDDFLSKSKNIMNKSVMAILALSISTGAMASTVNELQSSNLKGYDVKNVLIQDFNTSIKNDNFNNSYPSGIQSGIQIKNPQHLMKLTPQNFKYVIDNKISGVYAHPVLEGEVITYYFNDDPREDDLFKIISNQFHDLGLDSQGFASEYRAHKMISSAQKTIGQNVPSHHIQISHELYDDPNFTFMNLNKKLDNALNDEEERHYQEVFYASNLYTMYHEAFHAIGKKLEDNNKPNLTIFQKIFGTNHITSELDEYGQQMNIVEHAFTGHDKKVKAESQSFVGGHLMAYIISQQPESKISKEAFLDSFEGDTRDSGDYLMAKGSRDPHLYGPAYKVLNKLFQNNHDELMSMLPTGENQIPEKVVNLSNRIAIESVTFDFYPEIERNIEKKAVVFFEGLTKSIQEASEKEFGYFDKNEFVDEFIKLYENKIDSFDLDKITPREKDIIEAYESLKIFQDNPELLDDYKGFVQAKIDLFVENELDGNKSVKLVDIDYKHHIASIPMDSFVSHIEQTKEFKESIGNVISNNDWATIEYKPKQLDTFNSYESFSDEYDPNDLYVGKKMKLSEDETLIEELKNEINLDKNNKNTNNSQLIKKNNLLKNN